MTRPESNPTDFSRLQQNSQASAPGKVIICGEYSVLESWPALVVGVDRRVRVGIERQVLTETKASSGNTFIEVTASGLQDKQESLFWDENNKLQAQPGSRLSMLATILNALLKNFERSEFKKYCWSLRIDSQELFDTGDKLGLGSSAAMTVALDETLSDLFAVKPDVSGSQRWARLHAIHSQAQGKQGSGVDIAASLQGGLTVFRNPDHQHCDLQSFSLPENLYIAFIWSGASASTPKYLHSLSEWRKQAPEVYQRCINFLGECSSRVVQQTEAKAFIAELKQFSAALFEFARESGLPIFASGHEFLYQQALPHAELVYKPCGAGGGDLGVALASNEDSLKQFLAAMEGLDQRVLKLAVDAEGVITKSIG